MTYIEVEPPSMSSTTQRATDKDARSDTNSKQSQKYKLLNMGKSMPQILSEGSAEVPTGPPTRKNVRRSSVAAFGEGASAIQMLSHRSKSRASSDHLSSSALNPHMPDFQRQDVPRLSQGEMELLAFYGEGGTAGSRSLSD